MQDGAHRIAAQETFIMTPIKSFLFVPGDSDKKMTKAYEWGADALILDLEDSVALNKKNEARALTSAFLNAHPIEQRDTQIWVRVNPLDTHMMLGDLGAIMPGSPNGVVVPKANGPEDIRQVSHYLDAFEAQNDIAEKSTLVLSIATETAISPFRLGDYAAANLERLYGLTWGAEDLSTALGANTNLGGDGVYTHTYNLVRSLCLMAANAAGVHPVEAVFTDFKDECGLLSTSVQAYSEGFTGRLAIHPNQVAGIQSCFSPSEDDLAHARNIIAAFENTNNGGVASLNGKMLDAPHLKQAKRILGTKAHL